MDTIESKKSTRTETLRAAHLYSVNETVSDGIKANNNEIVC